MSQVKKAGIKELIDIFDQSLFHTLSPTSMVWQIVGAMELPHLDIDPKGKVWLDSYIPIDALSRYTGLTIESILQNFQENYNLFDFDLILKQKELAVYNKKLGYGTFLTNEVRSRDLHATYRNSVIHALKSRITYIKSLRSAELCVASGNLFNNTLTYWFQQSLL